MKFEHFDDENCDLMGSKDGVILDLPCFMQKDDEGNPEGFISKWVPSPEELQTLNAGGAIWLTVMGQRHPPVRLDVSVDLFADLRKEQADA